MDCGNCLNLQEDGLCGVYGKEPPAGFGARCLRFASLSAECGVRSAECAPSYERRGLRAESPSLSPHPSKTHSAPRTTHSTRLCRAEYCPFLVRILDRDYCQARVLPDRTEYLMLEEETTCPRRWTT